MNSVNYIFIGIFAVFLLDKSTRGTAQILLATYFYYYLVVVSFSDQFIFYVLVATGEFLAGSAILMLYGRMNTVNGVGYLYYIAILVNFVGWVMYDNDYLATTYNTLGLLVMIAQILAMIWRLLVDAGLYKSITNHRLFRVFNIVCNKSRNKLQNKPNKTKGSKCQN